MGVPTTKQQLADMQMKDLDVMFSQDIGRVTDRSQIINPYDIDPTLFGFTRRGKAQYQQYLNKAITYAQQQEAAYKEWYESPEQQAIRDRLAGLNPDLVGLGDSEAGSVSYDQPSPIEGIPTDGQMALNTITTFSQLIGSLSSVANLATAFTSLPGILQSNKNLIAEGDLLASQLTGQNLANETSSIKNIADLSLGISNDIANLFGAAKLVNPDLDIDEWFANDENFKSLDPIYSSNPRYPSVLAQSRKAVLDYQKSATADLADQASSNFDFGKILNNPLYSSDQKLMAAQLGPFMQTLIAQEVASLEFEKVLSDWMKERQLLTDPESAAEVINEENRYNADYFSALDPALAAGSQNAFNAENIEYLNHLDSRLKAAAENFFTAVNLRAERLRYEINKNYMAQYRADPNGYNGWRAAYLFSTNGGNSWSDYYLAHTQSTFTNKIHYEVQKLRWEARSEEASPWLDGVLGILGAASNMIRKK